MFIYLFRHEISELPQLQLAAHRHETLPHARHLGALYSASPEIRGPPLKKLGVKNMQNLGRCLSHYTAFIVEPRLSRVVEPSEADIVVQ